MNEDVKVISLRIHIPSSMNLLYHFCEIRSASGIYMMDWGVFITKRSCVGKNIPLVSSGWKTHGPNSSQEVGSAVDNGCVDRCSLT